MIKDELTVAIELHRQGEITKAKAIYQQLLEKHPDNIEALHLLSIINAQQNHFIEAEHYLQKALLLKPDTPELLNSMGNIKNSLGQKSQAIANYHQAIKLKPDYYVAYNSIGNICLAENRLNDAEENYILAIKYNPNYIDAHYNLALVYTKTNRIELTIYELDYILKMDPDHLQAHHKRAEIAQEQRDYTTAIFHYKQSLILNPSNIEAYHNLGAIFLILNNPQAALKYYLRLLQFGSDFDVYYNLGVIYSYQERYKDALLYFSRALEMNCNDIRTLQNIGVIYIKLGDHKQAREYYQRAQSIAPNNQEIKYILSALNHDAAFSKAPKEYISHLFDEYAPYFDQHLTQVLAYNVPALIKQAIDTVINSNDRLSILDLGCGTGLAAEPFKINAKSLIGVDLSEKMLANAAQKKIYDHLEKLDLIAALEKYKNQDLIIAADVLVYIGDLATLFSHVKKALTKTGFFVFTTEKSNTYPYTLNYSARYAHHKKYIEELISANNFSIAVCDNIILRKDKNRDIEGYLYALKAKQ